jgi:hypothetical protein
MGQIFKNTISWLWDNIYTLAFIIVFVFFLLRIEPIPRNGLWGSHYYRLILAFISIILLHIYFWLKTKNFKNNLPKQNYKDPKTNHRMKLFNLIIICACLFGVFNYYQFNNKNLIGINDYADITYYYINSKYFKELGYFDLYPAMLIADSEAENLLTKISRYRDLNDYQIVSAKKAQTDKARIKKNFSAQRWQKFKHDVDFLVHNSIAGGWSYFFIDHGYNPPPTWTIIGGTLSRLFPVELIKFIAMIDFVLIIIMFIFIMKAFSTSTMLFALLFFLCTFSGRWPVLGQSLLRFDWLAATVISVCLLKKERYGWAGGLFMYASLNRIFPAIFFWPCITIIGWQTIKNQSFSHKHCRFIFGAISVFIFLMLASVTTLGTEAFAQSVKNIKMHASTESYSSHRVGLGDALFYRGEKTRADINRHGGIQAKAKKIYKARHLLYGIGILSMFFIAFYIIKIKKPMFDSIYLSAIPLFCMQTPQINYFNLRILFVLTHMLKISKPRNLTGLTLLFLIEIITQHSHVSGNARYATTTTTSLGLTIYFIFIIGTMIYDLFKIYQKNSKKKLQYQALYDNEILS